MAATGALVYSELGTMIPVSGGEPTYLRRIYGPVPAFLSVWLMHFLLSGMRRAIGVLGFSKYLWSMFYENGEADVSWWLTKFICLVVFASVVALAAFKPTLILKCITVFTAAKLIGCVIIIIAGFVFLARGNTKNIAVGFEGTNTDLKDWSEAWNGIIWSYSGWENIVTVASEIQNPQKNIPIIVCSSVSIVTVLYVLTITSFHIVLPVADMAGEGAVAAEFGSAAMGDAGRVILAVIVMLSALGSVQCTFMYSSRYIHSSAVEGLLPQVFDLVSTRFKTPIVSIFYVAIGTAAFVLIGNIDDLIDSASFTMFPWIVLSCFGVFVMRYTHPDLHRPYKVPLIFPALMTLFGVFVFVSPFIGKNWLISLIWVLITLLGIPIYYLLVKNVFGIKWIGRVMGVVRDVTARVLGCE